MPACMSSMCRLCVDPGFVRTGMVSCGFVGALLVSRHRGGRSVLLCLRSQGGRVAGNILSESNIVLR